MKLFIDSANLQEIEAALRRGFVRGITTNPSLIAKEPKTQFKAHIERILSLIRTHQPGVHLSVEVFSRDPEEILLQAEDFVSTFGYPELSIKVQVGFDELGVIRALAEKNISVNCTCAMSAGQAIMAAAAGARYVSLFWGRIRDFGKEEYATVRRAMIERGDIGESDCDPAGVVRAVRDLFDRSYPGVEIIAGSIRRVTDVLDAGRAGAHIVTVPPKFFPPMIAHPKTDEVIEEFMTKFSAWLGSDTARSASRPCL